MTFMQPQITERTDWYEVDGPSGTEWLPADLVGLCATGTFDRAQPIPDVFHEYCENSEAWSITKATGYGARLSAPGYMDCTNWCVFKTKEEARDYLRDTYDTCPDCGADLSEKVCGC